MPWTSPIAPFSWVVGTHDGTNTMQLMSIYVSVWYTWKTFRAGIPCQQTCTNHKTPPPTSTITSKVNVTRSRSLPDTCCVRHKSRKNSPRNTKIRNNGTSFNVKRSNSQRDWKCIIYQMGTPVNLKIGRWWSMRYQQPRPLKFDYCKQAGHTASAAPGGHTTC